MRTKGASKASKGRMSEKFNQRLQALQECSMQATSKCSVTDAISFRMQSLDRGIFSALEPQSVLWFGATVIQQWLLEQFTLTRFLGQCTLGNGHTR